MRTMFGVVFVAMASLAPAAARAQVITGSPYPPHDNVRVGVGLSGVSTLGLNGDGAHLSVAFPLSRRPRLGHRYVGQLFYGRSSLGNLPTGCRMLSAEYCMFRTDRLEMLGAMASLRMDVRVRRAFPTVRPFLVPIGVSAYVARRETHETEGPFYLCFTGTDVVSCPGQPPLHTVSARDRRGGLGLNAGFGADRTTFGRTMFAEVFANAYVVGNRGQALLASVGVSF